MERSRGEAPARAGFGTLQRAFVGSRVLTVRVIGWPQGGDITVWRTEGCEVRNMSQYGGAISSAFTLVALLVVSVEGAAQVGSGARSSDSYHYLSERAKPFALGLAGSETGYNSLRVSERTTFEAIMHALETEGLLRIVKSVAKAWGQGPGSGVDQFRLSLVLARGAVALLRDQPDFDHSIFGHVKLPSGRVIDREHLQFLNVDSVRQRRKADLERQASLQVSWKEDNPLVAEVDIDYRTISDSGHNRPDNSDIQSRTDEVSHYDLHVQTYGEGLDDWWRQP